MENQAIDAQTDSEEDVKIDDVSHEPHCLSDNDLTAQEHLSSLCPENSELHNQTNNKQAKHQQCQQATSTAQNMVKTVPDQAVAASLNANELLDCDKMDQTNQCLPVTETQQVTEQNKSNNREKLKICSMEKSITEQTAQSYHTDQLSTIAIEQQQQQHQDNLHLSTKCSDLETESGSDQLQSIAVEASDSQLTELRQKQSSWPTPLKVDLNSVNLLQPDSSTIKPGNGNVHTETDSLTPLVRLQHQVPVDHSIEHQLLQSASTVSDAQSILRRNDQHLHLRHPLEPLAGDELSGDSESATSAFLSSASDTSCTSPEPVTRRATTDVVVAGDDAATAEKVVASGGGGGNSSAALPPCDNLPGERTNEESALSFLRPPIASLTSSTSFPTTSSPISSIATAVTSISRSSSENLPPSLSKRTSAHQRETDITGTATSIGQQGQQHDINSCQQTQRRPAKTVDKKLPSDRVANNKSSKRLEKQYPLTTFNSDRETSISFLASYPPQTTQTESNVASLASPQFGASSIDSFSEHTPLLGTSHSKSSGKYQTQQSSSTSLSSSTLSLFLESLKVNVGLKNDAGKKSLKSKRIDTITQFENPLVDQHIFVDVHDNPPVDHLSPLMSNQFDSPVGSIALREVPPVAGAVENMTHNQQAIPMSSSTVSAGKSSGQNGYSVVRANGASSTFQAAPTAQQRYLASLLDGGNEVNYNASTSKGQSAVGASFAQQQQSLAYQPYPNPKSSTAPAVAAMTAVGNGRHGQPSSAATAVTVGGNGHCNHRTHHHRCYVSSGSYDAATPGLTTTDDDTCSMSTSTSKHDESFSLKFPKLRYVKVALLAGLIIYTLISFIAIQEKEDKWTNVAAQEGIPAYVDLSHSLDLMFPVWKLRAKGSFLPAEYGKLTNYSIVFTVVQLLNDSQGADRNGAYRLVKGPWAAPITPPKLSQYMNTEVEHVFKLTRGDAYDHIHRYQLRIDTNSEESVGITVNMAGFSELSADGIILATTVLVFLYTLIIFEIVNRTLAAMLGATAAITCLTLIRDRPSLEKVVSWLDVETLCLLFGMMVLVAILCETGFFDYIAVVAFRLAKGRTWPLIFTLCFFTGILSAFLDNVTTILLMTPVTIRLCEIKNIDPKFVLIAQVMFSNIGGAATPVGDPPNVIIISSLKIQKQGVDFGRFTLHMMPGILLSFAATLLYIRIAYRSLSSNDISESNSSDIESTPTTKTNSASVPYQYTLPPGPVASSLDPPRPQSEPQFGRPTQSGVPSSAVGGVSGSSSRRPGARNVSASPNQLESSSEFDGYSYGHSHAARSNRLLRSGSGHHGKDAVEQCLSCNSMDDFCAGTSVRDSILDERRVFRSSDELKREIEVWKRATNSISGYSRDENSVRNVLNRKVEILETVLQEHCYETVPPEDNYHSVLAELEEKYKIRDYPLLYKSGIVMSLVISLFFLQSIPNLDLSLGWIAILGAILLLVLADRHELESIISRVEWSTLIFFAALFVVMEALAELKFLWWIGRLTQDFINSVPEAQRLVVAILLFTWISAFASSFIDNIPLTTVMVKILEDLSENNEFNIPLVPLIYALAFGACLGGNGTLIGASSNVVCAGVAEQHGYRFTFMDFFRVGFPIMLLTVGISSVYLVVCHVIFDWNY